MRPRLRGLLAALIVFCSTGTLFALAVANPVLGYTIDLPVGWVQAENSDAYHIGFLSANSDAMIQVMALDPATADGGLALANYMLSEVSATGEPEEFEYQGRSAALSDIAFTTNGLAVSGYVIAIDDRTADYILLAFAVNESYSVAHDQLLSALDGFSIGEESRVYPGPVSQFFYPYPAPNQRKHTIDFSGDAIAFQADDGELDETKVLVDREARVLEPYGSLDRDTFSDAWRRFFRMIYRDNYMRLEPLAKQIDAALTAKGVPRVDYPAEILAWLQGFQYVQTGGLSDFQPPISCLETASGDCDSLAMTYVILLNHLGFDAILMASDRYAHALAAVDMPGPGARFTFEGKQWLVAELTAKVAIGQIAASMADPAGWIGVRMRLAAQ